MLNFTLQHAANWDTITSANAGHGCWRTEIQYISIKPKYNFSHKATPEHSNNGT